MAYTAFSRTYCQRRCTITRAVHCSQRACLGRIAERSAGTVRLRAAYIKRRERYTAERHKQQRALC